MNVRILWMLVALVGAAFMSLRRAFYHLNYALPHYLTVNVANPPYVVKTLMKGYSNHWTPFLFNVLTFLCVLIAIIIVMNYLVEESQ